jgi:pSer/pThr/pTyr-binding forkhead associated (FHA) protein
MQRRLDKPSSATITLTSPKTLVGRAQTCDLVIPHLSISRNHAELSVIGNLLTVRDLESRNGTFVDGKPVTSCDVHAGQLLRFGSISFLIADNAVTSAGPNGDLATESWSRALESMFAESDRLDLTDAQRRVFELLLEGLAEKQVAARLKVSPHTVHNHVRKIYAAAGVGSRAELLVRFGSPKTLNRICLPTQL